jgi:hypothetical protein
MASARDSYLFDPVAVRGVLTNFPALADKLRPDREGTEARSFRSLRKSRRQVYRVLGNTHYDHLKELLEALDACLQHGYEQPRLLRTRSRSSFAPDLAELRAAEHFMRTGCAISGFDDSKENQSVPDLLATAKSGFRVAVEVYCPIAFEHLERFGDDLRSGVKNLDSPYDFAFRVEFKKLVEFNPETMRLVYLLPDVLDTALKENGLGPSLVSTILNHLAARLENRQSAVTLCHDVPELNLRITLDLDHIELAPDRLPARMGVFNAPDTAVPAPEWVFARIAQTPRTRREKVRPSTSMQTPPF